MTNEIQKAIRVLCEPGQVYELRCPKSERGTVSGYFDDFEALARTADALDGQVPAVYITLNPVLPDLLARANNCHKYKAVNTTGDAEITRRLRLLIDCDPIRPAGISSSDAEHEAGLQRCRDIRDFLTAQGFPMPLFGDSSNGGHLIYGIDLANDVESAELVKRFLESLASRFDDAVVSVDRSVWNAARISKMYGTKSMKGDPTTNRPHRYSRIIETPDKLEAVPVELLRKIAGHAEEPQSKSNTANRTNTNGKAKRTGFKTADDVERMMDDAGLDYRIGEPYKGGTRWELNECPNAETHTSGPGGSAVFLQDGIVGFKCQHAHCVDIHATDVFGAVNGKSKAGKFDKQASDFVTHHSDRGEFPLFTSSQMYFYDKNRYVNCGELAMKVREYFKHRGWPQSNNVIGNVARIVESHGWKDSTKFGMMPFWSGDDCPFEDHRNVLAYQNGLLNVNRLEAGLMPHSPNWCSTFCLPFEHDSTATCPTWDRFLLEVFSGDSDRAALLQEFFGYCMSSDTSLQKALVLVGKPRSGKGTCQRMLEHLIGSESTTGFSLDKLPSEFGLSSLLNKSLATVGEVELSGNKDRNKIVEMLKSIIGEDSVLVNEKHKSMTSVRLPTRFVIATNQCPRLMDSSGALGHRLLFVPFEECFADRADPKLEGKLQLELPGIANWALKGLLRLRSNSGRFTLGDKHKQMADKFNADTSPVLAWIKSECIVSSWANSGDIPPDCIVNRNVQIEKQAAFESFNSWCEDNDIPTKTQEWFGSDLAQALPKVWQSQPRIDGRRVRVYVGFAIKDCPTSENDDGNDGKKTETSGVAQVAQAYCLLPTTFQSTKIEEEEGKLQETSEPPVPPVPVPEPPQADETRIASSLVVQPQSKTRRDAIREAMNMMYVRHGDDGKQWIAMPKPNDPEVWKFGQMQADGTLTFFRGDGSKTWAMEQIDQRIYRIQYEKPTPSEPRPEAQLIPEDKFWAELAAM